MQHHNAQLHYRTYAQIRYRIYTRKYGLKHVLAVFLQKSLGEREEYYTHPAPRLMVYPINPKEPDVSLGRRRPCR